MIILPCLITWLHGREFGVIYIQIWVAYFTSVLWVETVGLDGHAPCRLHSQVEASLALFRLVSFTMASRACYDTNLCLVAVHPIP